VDELIAAQQQRIAELEEKLAETQRQLDLLVRQIFGRKSERTGTAAHPDQMDLELEAENAVIESAPPVRPPQKKGGSQKGRKVRAALLPENLPVEQTVIIPLAVQAAPEKYRQINEEVVERLERIPGKLIVLRLVRPTFVRIDEPFAAPVTAPAPPALIEGGFFGPQFMVDMALGKYLYHQPLYRQAKGIEWESGIKLSLATMCQTIARLSDAVQPVVDHMAKEMWKSGRVQMDLTPVRCLSREHDGGSFLGQMWVSAAMDGTDVLYTWDQSKEALVAERIVPDWFIGILQCDGDSSIACFMQGGKGRTRPPPPIIRAACWAHVRRKFFEAARAGCSLARRILKRINLLYRIEAIARERGCTAAQLLALRQKHSRRVMALLRRRLDATLAAVRPKTPVGKACLYALGQWDALQVYLDNAEVPVDNNGVERAIRPCAIGKKNYLFIGDVGAGQRSATLYSLLGSCLRRGINPRDYLHWLFERLPSATNQTVHTLTPAAYAAMIAAAAGPAETAAA
jgi:transposase